MIKLRGNRLLVSLIREEKTKGGIIVPISARQPFYKYVVVKKGPDVDTINDKDVVVIPSGAGTTIKLDGEEYQIVNADVVVGVMDKSIT